MDPIDGFYQAMDSEQLLDAHGPGLVTDARRILAANPAARVGGMITLPDSPDAPTIAALLAQATGRPVGKALLVGLVPRQMLEPLLRQHAGTDHWMEQGWQPQHVLPVLVSTRDGMRFGFFPLPRETTER
jgi:hypothetical protein